MEIKEEFKNHVAHLLRREQKPGAIVDEMLSKNDPMRKSIAILVIFLSACANKVPELGRDLPWSWSDQTPYFDQRIKDRFPIGSDKAALVDELRREGFSIRQANVSERWFRHVAVYDQQGPCRETWLVAWDDDQTKLTNIEGRYHQVCL